MNDELTALDDEWTDCYRVLCDDTTGSDAYWKAYWRMKDIEKLLEQKSDNIEPGAAAALI